MSIRGLNNIRMPHTHDQYAYRRQQAAGGRYLEKTTQQRTMETQQYEPVTSNQT